MTLGVRKEKLASHCPLLKLLKINTQNFLTDQFCHGTNLCELCILALLFLLIISTQLKRSVGDQKMPKAKVLTISLEIEHVNLHPYLSINLESKKSLT